MTTYYTLTNGTQVTVQKVADGASLPPTYAGGGWTIIAVFRDNLAAPALSNVPPPAPYQLPPPAGTPPGFIEQIQPDGSIAWVTPSGIGGSGATINDSSASGSSVYSSVKTVALLAGKADLVGGTVPRAQLPSIAGVTDVTGVANQAAMLALTQPDADTQLRVIRTDTPGSMWVLNPGLNPATLANWIQEPFDASGAAAAAQAAAIAAAATDATTKANAAQAAAATDATTKVGTEQTRAQGVEALKAPLASPNLTGTPTAPTAAVGTNSTQLANTAFVAAALAALVGSAPSQLDTIYELAAALTSDESAAATLTTLVGNNTTAIGQRLPELLETTVSASSGQLAYGVMSTVAAGGTYTSPALAGTVPTDGTPPRRFGMRAPSTGTAQVSFPNVAGTTVNVTLLPGETRIYRQLSTSGWGLESGIPLAQLDARFGLTPTLHSVAASGAALTLDPPANTKDDVYDVTLTANCTITLPAVPRAGASFMLRLNQDSTGGRTVTWPAGLKWTQAAAPVLSSGAGKSDVLTFVSFDGTVWYGFLAGLDMR